MEKIYNYSDIESNKSLNTLYYLFDLSLANYDENNVVVKRKAINSTDAYKFILNFFSSLSNSSKKSIVKRVRNLYNITHFIDEVNGGVFATNGKVTKVLSSKFTDIFRTSIGVHEYTHALDYDNSINISKYLQLKEIAPILNQLLFLEYLKKDMDTKEVIDTSDTWFLNQHFYRNLIIFILNNNLAKDDIKKFKDTIVDDHFIYMISSLYALSLYDIYKENNVTFLEKYKKIYDENITIEDLLKYYNISLESDVTIKTVKRRLNNKK